MKKINEIHDAGYSLSSFKMNGIVVVRVSNIDGFLEQVSMKSFRKCINKIHKRIK